MLYLSVFRNSAGRNRVEQSTGRKQFVYVHRAAEGDN